MLMHRICRQNPDIIVMNKLEKVALRSARRTGKPLVLVLNNVHLFNNDDSGRNMLLQLQQRAEAWAASGKLFCASERVFTPDASQVY